MISNSSLKKQHISIGIDIGGTFTDFVAHDSLSGEFFTLKVLSTPEAPEEAVLSGINRLLARMEASLDQVRAVFHGSTVATNALLERKGARTALVTTAGFKDVLEIGRQNRPELYNLFTPIRQPLIPAALRMEVDERIDRHGQVLKPLDLELEWLVARLRAQSVEAVAICLLFSFANPIHEQQLGTGLQTDDLFTCISSEVLPEFREYERTSTTAINAYVTPVLRRYLQRLEQQLQGIPLFVMQSTGGSISVQEASQSGVRCILSGPAGGVAAATFISKQTTTIQNSGGFGVLTFDMGGTSTDVALIKDAPITTRESQIDGYPIAISMLDIHTIGAGGGSIAAVDAGGALIVGPQSAGAYPGPACYGLGTQPTVTDANLVLGRILPDHFLGGEMRLYPERALAALEVLSQQLGLPVPVCAQGIVDVANAHMAKALRVISVEKGEDPADFTLLSFGGAGGLHAVELARLIGIPRVLIPQTASVFSAFGMLVTDTIKEFAHTVMLAAEAGYDHFAQAVAPLMAQAKEVLLNEGIREGDWTITPSLDMRYQGQSYEINIPLSPGYVRRFHQAHHELYGYRREHSPIEVVNVRVKASGRKPDRIEVKQSTDPRRTLQQAHLGSYPVYVTDVEEPTDVPVFLAERLPDQCTLTGPAVIVRPDTTIYIGSQDKVLVDAWRNIVITLEH